jgi:hypothetical protein
MRKYAVIALLVMSALMLASQNAYAGGCRHGCGESRGNYDAPQPYWGTYRVVVPTFVSDHPRHGYGTDIRLKPGAVVQAKCFPAWAPRWCKVRTEAITHAFVPRHCLSRVKYYNGEGYLYRRHHRHHHYPRYESRENGYFFSERNGHERNGDDNGDYGNPYRYRDRDRDRDRGND